MVRAALVDVVLRHAEYLGGREFLQRCLPVQAGAEPGRARDDRIEEPVHQGVGFGQPPVEVDGAEHRLERVGQDR